MHGYFDSIPAFKYNAIYICVCVCVWLKKFSNISELVYHKLWLKYKVSCISWYDRNVLSLRVATRQKWGTSCFSHVRHIPNEMLYIILVLKKVTCSNTLLPVPLIILAITRHDLAWEVFSARIVCATPEALDICHTVTARCISLSTGWSRCRGRCDSCPRSVTLCSDCSSSGSWRWAFQRWNLRCRCRIVARHATQQTNIKENWKSNLLHAYWLTMLAYKMKKKKRSRKASFSLLGTFNV